MPQDNDGNLVLDHDDDDPNHIHEESEDMAQASAESGNLQVAMTILANGAAAGANRRTDAADQLSSDSQRMWSIHMTTPTVLAAHGMRIAAEAGAGRTRLEGNTPASTQAIGN